MTLFESITTDEVVEAETHKALCRVAVSWLRRPPSKGGPACSFAVSETSPMGMGEIPDAIGWREGKSTLVEVKVSRSDFLADRLKPHRIEPTTGMGCYRYYMAPSGLIRIDDLPDRWGLIEVRKGGVAKVIAGHVLEPYAKQDDGYFARNLSRWEFSAALDKECHFLSRLFSRVGDPEVVNAELKKASRIISNLESSLERERKTNRDLSQKYWRLLYEAGVRSEASLDQPTEPE